MCRAAAQCGVTEQGTGAVAEYREALSAFHWACTAARQRNAAGGETPQYIRVLAETAAIFGDHDPEETQAFWDMLSESQQAMLAALMQTHLASDAQWQARLDAGTKEAFRAMREGWIAALIEAHRAIPSDLSREAQLAALHANRTVEETFEEGWLLLSSGAWRKSAQVSFLIPAALIRYRHRHEVGAVFPMRPERFADLIAAEQATARLMRDLLCTGDNDPLDAIPVQVDQFSPHGEALVSVSVIFYKECARLFDRQRPETIPMGAKSRHVMDRDFSVFDAAHDLTVAAMRALA